MIAIWQSDAGRWCGLLDRVSIAKWQFSVSGVENGVQWPRTGGGRTRRPIGRCHEWFPRSQKYLRLCNELADLPRATEEFTSPMSKCGPARITNVSASGLEAGRVNNENVDVTADTSIGVYRNVTGGNWLETAFNTCRRRVS